MVSGRKGVGVPNVLPRKTSKRQLRAKDRRVVRVGVRRCPQVTSRFELGPVCRLTSDQVAINVIIGDTIGLGALNCVQQVVLVKTSLCDVTCGVTRLCFSIQAKGRCVYRVIRSGEFADSLRERSFASSVNASYPDSFYGRIAPLSVGPRKLV